MIALSCVVVLATYAVLIETWRRIIIAWGDHLGFVDAARIWCVSNLGRYVPGKVWQIGVMAKLARERSVSVSAAAGSAIVNTVVNIATGFVVALIAGWSTADRLTEGHASLGIALAVLLIAGLLMLPALLPWVLRFVRRTTGRTITLGVLPRSAIYLSIVGNVIAWALYGVAFQIFVAGVIGATPGRTSDYIAVYASSYIIGYLALAIPGGAGVREGALIDALVILNLATVGQATVVAVTSRIWLIVFEILPALIFLARGARRPPQRVTARDG